MRRGNVRRPLGEEHPDENPNLPLRNNSRRQHVDVRGLSRGRTLEKLNRLSREKGSRRKRNALSEIAPTREGARTRPSVTGLACRGNKRGAHEVNQSRLGNLAKDVQGVLLVCPARQVLTTQNRRNFSKRHIDLGFKQVWRDQGPCL